MSDANALLARIHKAPLDATVRDLLMAIVEAGGGDLLLNITIPGANVPLCVMATSERATTEKLHTLSKWDVGAAGIHLPSEAS